MRAFAVLMMIQGHTIDTFLSNEYRTLDSYFYFTWYTMRGFTAPIFMFTAGMIFTYLLNINNHVLLSNTRVKKGVKRGAALILIGYLLRYPTHRIFDFTYVTNTQWTTFFTVDALHLIGFGLLSIILVYFITTSLKTNFNLVLSVAILMIFLASPIVSQFNWNNYLPEYLTAYLYDKNGSLFPLFPWLTYVLTGALLGSYLYKNKNIYLKKRFSFLLMISGAALIFISMVFSSFGNSDFIEFKYWFQTNSIVVFRIGFVVFLNGLISFLVRKINSIPKTIYQAGKKTLMLYVAHIIILYGCVFFPGLNKFFNKSFSLLESIFAALIMFVVMYGVIETSERIKHYRKRKPAFNKI